MNPQDNQSLLRQALIESWIGVVVLVGYIVAILLGQSQIIIGALAVLTAVLFMNGFAKTELFLTAQGASWWRHHPSIKWLHHVSEEGELAGVFIGVVFLIAMMSRDGAPEVHIPVAGALSLVGIMASAALAVRRVIPIIAFAQKHFGVHVALFLGALLSSITGAAASVFVCEYFKEKIKEEKKADFAVRFSAALSLGNGLFPFAAPPVLIVWALLQEKLGWDIGTLFLMVGIPAIIYAFLLTWRMERLLDGDNLVIATPKIALGYQLPLLILVVVANIIDYTSLYAMGINLFSGVLMALKGEDFQERFSPWILGLLLIALEIIGSEANAFVSFLATSIVPNDASPLIIGLILFYSAAFISHFADNALASKLVISAAVATPLFATHGDFLATSVVLGALAGGFALIPANLPNFPIARILKISPSEWGKSALKIYPSILFFIFWIAGLYYVLE